jgi:glucans biosynthesis protein C
VTGAEGRARASIAIDNLRAFVILLVLSFHAALAYLAYLPSRPFAFDAPPFLWRSFPIVDARRWFGFDIYCAWQDVFLMSLFFFVSGLFVWPSLKRKGAGRFVFDRIMRIGLPFVVVVLLEMPVALYPSYLQTAARPGLAGYLRHWLALPFWPTGPVWFLWLLLVGAAAAAVLYELAPAVGEAWAGLASRAVARPVAGIAGFALLSALAYVPLALAFTPMRWCQWGPFSFQLSRPLHYALYFLAGIGLGAAGIHGGAFSCDGFLAGRWRRWLTAAFVSFALWLGLTALSLHAGAALWLRAADDLSFVLACGASGGTVLAVFLRFGGGSSPLLDSLRRNAYGMYLVHYPFIVWLQYALLAAALPAIVKAALVFLGTLSASWAVTAAMRLLPALAPAIGDGGRRALPRSF